VGSCTFKLCRVVGIYDPYISLMLQSLEVQLHDYNSKDHTQNTNNPAAAE
jgi:hypothetical protein